MAKFSTIIYVIFGLIIPMDTICQALNDNIANRIRLNGNEPFLSNTTGCTVEPTCVDESLTGKCIKYHNDQWFSFYSETKQQVYANISGQRCRDMKGVQLVVIDGSPCEVDTYKILSCISLATQDNFYEPIDLEANKEYLLNIDGYLHDFCEFFISIDSVAYGFPTRVNFETTTNLVLEGKVVTLNWTLPDSMQTNISHFEIHQRKYKKWRFDFVAQVDVQRNSYGLAKEEYSYTDSLADFRRTHFKLIAVDNDNRMLLMDEFEF